MTNVVTERNIHLGAAKLRGRVQVHHLHLFVWVRKDWCTVQKQFVFSAFSANSVWRQEWRLHAPLSEWGWSSALRLPPWVPAGCGWQDLWRWGISLACTQPSWLASCQVELFNVTRPGSSLLMCSAIFILEHYQWFYVLVNTFQLSLWHNVNIYCYMHSVISYRHGVWPVIDILLDSIAAQFRKLGFSCLHID